MVKTLYEIPIYAVTRKQLEERYEKYIKRQRKKFQETWSDNIRDILTFLQRSWNYNHIVGYIKITFDESMVLSEIFLPYEEKKYQWRSNRKVWLYNIMANGTHFPLETDDTSDSIRSKMVELVGLSIEHIPKKYFVDKESFSCLNSIADYSKLLEE